MKNTSRSIVTEPLESRTLFSLSPASIVPHVLNEAPLLSSPVVQTTGTGITAEYFAGDDFQTPMAVQQDRGFGLSWVSEGAGKALIHQVFTVKFTGQVAVPVTGTYTFYAPSDSGTRLIVNGATVIDNFAGRGISIPTGTIALTGGTQVSIELDYVSLGRGIPKVHLFWSATGVPYHQLPTQSLYPATVSLPAEALTTSYYTGKNFNDLKVTQVDSLIDTAKTFPSGVLSPDSPYSIQWNGTILAPATGTYTFRAVADDGVRLFIDGNEIINYWHAEPPTAHVASITLVAGQTYSLEMQTYNGVLSGVAKLYWITPGTTKPVSVPFVSAVPAAPANVSATPFSPSQIDLSWSDVAGESGFIVERSTDGGLTFSQIGTTAEGVTTFDDTGLTALTTYDYEVIAVSAAGDSPASAVASAITLPNLPSQVVASATVSGTTATISWTASATPSYPTAPSYLVQRSLNGTSGWTTVGTTYGTTLQDTGLSNATTYYYQVTASNVTGSGEPSTPVSITTVPAAPANLAATVASPSEIDLQWSDVTGETGFIVEESANGTSGWTQIGSNAAGTTSLPVGGLAAATQYFFQVIAIGAGGDSAPSNIANATTSAANPTYATLTTLYGLGGNGNVYSINTTTGAATQVGTLLFGTNAGARDPLTGNLFYASTGSGSIEIASWNPNDGVNTIVNSAAVVGNPVAQAAFRDDGQGFLTTDMGQLYIINNNTAVPELQGILHANGSVLDTGNGDIAFAPNDTLYIETSSELYSVSNAAVNAANGSGSVINATDIGPTNSPNLQIAFGQNGVLYGTDNSGQLYTLNAATGTATAVGTPSGVNMGDLASVPLYSNLSVAQTASTFVRGSNGAYSLTVSNAGPDTTVGATTLVDTLPTGVTYVSGSGAGWTFSVSGSTVTMTYTANIAAGVSAPVATLNVAIGSGAASSVSNTVTASTTEFQTDTADNLNTISSPVTG